MKKEGIISIIGIAVFACLLLCTPVNAPGNPGAGCPSETKFYYTINGGIYFEQDGWMQINAMTKTFNDVPDGIKFARVYTGVWGGSPGKGGDFNITVNGNTSPTYSACDPCPNATGCMPYQPLRCDTVNMSECHDYVTGCNVHFITYNATPYIVPGSNTVTVKAVRNESCHRGRWDGRIYLIALLVVYEDARMPEMTYWINEGAPYMENGSYCDGPDDHLNISFYFNGTHISNPAKVKYWTLGFPHVANATTEPAYMKLNGNNISKYDYKEGYGGYEVLYRWYNIPASYLNPSSNLFSYYKPSASYGGYGMYERVNVAVLMVYEKEEEFFDTGTPANSYPSIFGMHNGTITVDRNVTVNRMYTYPCSGTGGHTEFVKIWNETAGDYAEARWDGYIGDYHNISFNRTLVLKKGVIYNYTIRTGSYPQIHHTHELTTDNGTIRCTEFVDANGRLYKNWIPAIKLWE